MGNIISVLYILAFAGCGILTARPIFASDRPLKRILFGLTFGLDDNGVAIFFAKIQHLLQAAHGALAAGNHRDAG